jgi:hypothetical protein
MKDRIVEPEEAAIAKQRISTLAPAATTDMQETTDEPLEALLYTQSMSKAIKQRPKRSRQLVVRQSPPGKNVSRKAQESPLLAAVTKQRPLKTQQTDNTQCVLL